MIYVLPRGVCADVRKLTYCKFTLCSKIHFERWEILGITTSLFSPNFTCVYCNLDCNDLVYRLKNIYKTYQHEFHFLRSDLDI
ncbi:hypothetical protein CR513_40718, partial [Mucuna pruriens]